MKKIFWIFIGLFLFTLTGCNFSNGDPVVNQQLFDELTTKVNEFNSKIETSDYLSIRKLIHKTMTEIFIVMYLIL